MDTIMGMMKPFLNKHLLVLLHLHPAPIDSFFKHVPKKIMLKELGGDGPSFEEFRGNFIDFK
jgi:hypothetical protein